MHSQKNDQEIIVQASASVHDGDPIVDAVVFRQQFRRDPELYMELYGIGFEQAYSVRKSAELIIRTPEATS